MKNYLWVIFSLLLFLSMGRASDNGLLMNVIIKAGPNISWFEDAENSGTGMGYAFSVNKIIPV